MALNEQGPESDDQRAIGARERTAESLDGTPIRLGGWPIVREIVDKSGVDHAIGSRGAAAKAFEIFERAAMHLGTSSDKRLGARI